MKKTIIALMGLFTLLACSDDAVENAETQTESTGVQNGIKTVTNSGVYQSPWDVNNIEAVEYFFNSHVTSGKGVYVRVTPYIGLAYYDGADDGIYNSAGGGSYNLASGAYPNLYANGNEYGNYVTANPIILFNGTLAGATWNTHELAIVSHVKTELCPMINVNVGLNYNLYAIKFDIMNNNVVQPASIFGYTVPATPGTPAEQNLLSEFGKVMYYKVEFSADGINFPPQAFYTMALEDNMSDPEWTSLGLSDNLFGAKLFYHSGGPTSPTYEIVASNASISSPDFVRHNIPFSAPGSLGVRRIYTLSGGLPILSINFE